MVWSKQQIPIFITYNLKLLCPHRDIFDLFTLGLHTAVHIYLKAEISLEIMNITQVKVSAIHDYIITWPVNECVLLACIPQQLFYQILCQAY